MATPDEVLSKILGLKNKISDVRAEFLIFQNDWYLYYWLRAQKMNVQKAETMIRKSVEWRREHLESSLSEGEAKLLKQQLNIYTSRSEDGSKHVTFYSTFPEDLINLIASQRKNVIQLTANVLYNMERCRIDHINRKFKTLEDQINYSPNYVHVVDLGAMSFKLLMSAAVITISAETTQILPNNFPGIITRIDYVNVGRIASIFLKPLLSIISSTPGTEVNAYGAEDESWKLKLLQVLGPDEVPTHFGGTKQGVIRVRP